VISGHPSIMWLAIQTNFSVLTSHSLVLRSFIQHFVDKSSEECLAAGLLVARYVRIITAPNLVC
jgi:hypothetical protein